MARTRQWTEEFIVPEFYKLFHGLTAAEQTGVIRGLATIRECKAAVAVPPQDEATPPEKPAADKEAAYEQQMMSLAAEIAVFPGESAEDAGTQEAP